MGVLGLQTYMEDRTKCPGVVCEVDIRQLAESAIHGEALGRSWNTSLIFLVQSSLLFKALKLILSPLGLD